MDCLLFIRCEIHTVNTTVMNLHSPNKKSMFGPNQLETCLPKYKTKPQTQNYYNKIWHIYQNLTGKGTSIKNNYKIN